MYLTQLPRCHKIHTNIKIYCLGYRDSYRSTFAAGFEDRSSLDSQCFVELETWQY